MLASVVLSPLSLDVLFPLLAKIHTNIVRAVYIIPSGCVTHSTQRIYIDNKALTRHGYTHIY